MEKWVHDPNRDGAGCSWCGAFAQVNRHNECRDCWADIEAEDQAATEETLASGQYVPGHEDHSDRRVCQGIGCIMGDVL